MVEIEIVYSAKYSQLSSMFPEQKSCNVLFSNVQAVDLYRINNYCEILVLDTIWVAQLYVKYARVLSRRVVSDLYQDPDKNHENRSISWILQRDCKW